MECSMNSKEVRVAKAEMPGRQKAADEVRDVWRHYWEGWLEGLE